MTIFLIGEHNPYDPLGHSPEQALAPYPAQSTGGRLCAALGLTADDYLRRFPRYNLLPQLVSRNGGIPGWYVPEARLAARRVVELTQPTDGLVLLGAKVSAAFGLSYREWLTHRPETHGVWTAALDARPGWAVSRYVLVLPHPSGLSRDWPGPYGARRAREAVATLAAVSAGTHVRE